MKFSQLKPVEVKMLKTILAILAPFALIQLKVRLSIEKNHFQINPDYFSLHEDVTPF
jgi:hypothetical protein